MEAYISPEKINNKIVLFFYGNNFKKNLIYQKYREFITECQIDIREIKRLIDDMGRNERDENKEVIFTGGEPLLQKHPLNYLLSYAKAKGMKTILESNISKPETLKYVIKNIDEIRIVINYNFEHFNTFTGASTFFKSEEEIKEDILNSISLINSENIKKMNPNLKRTIIAVHKPDKSIDKPQLDIRSIASTIKKIDFDELMIKSERELFPNEVAYIKENFNAPISRYINLDNMEMS